MVLILRIFCSYSMRAWPSWSFLTEPLSTSTCSFSCLIRNSMANRRDSWEGLYRLLHMKLCPYHTTPAPAVLLSTCTTPNIPLEEEECVNGYHSSIARNVFFIVFKWSMADCTCISQICSAENCACVSIEYFVICKVNDGGGFFCYL